MCHHVSLWLCRPLHQAAPGFHAAEKSASGESQCHLLTRWTLLSLAPARAAASPDTDPSSVPAPWPAPAGSGGGGGGAAPMGGGGTGGGGGGGGPPDEAGITAAPLG